MKAKLLFPALWSQSRLRSYRTAKTTNKLLFPALWVIVSLAAMLFEPVSLADFGVKVYFAYYLFFVINAGTAAHLVDKQISKYLNNRSKKDERILQHPFNIYSQNKY
jgi:hypothetical protein